MPTRFTDKEETYEAQERNGDVKSGSTEKSETCVKTHYSRLTQMDNNFFF